MTFDRRALLRAAGATVIVPPFVRHALAAPATLPPRLVILRWSDGTNQEGFWPKAANLRSPILDPIVTTPGLAAKTTVVKGIKLEVDHPLGNEHDNGGHSFWTGVDPVGTHEDSWGGGPSLDQVCKRAVVLPVPYPSLNVAVLAAFMGQKTGHRSSLSYVGPRQQIPAQTDVYRLYDAFFGGPGPSAPPSRERALARLRKKRSVLDSVAADLKSLEGRLPAGERRKLGEHTTALRELETRLELAAGIDTTPASCPKGTRPAAGLNHNAEDQVPALCDAMLSFVGLALACNLTRIVTFQFGFCGHQWFYKWLGIGKDGHADVAHLDDGKNPAVAAEMVKIGAWHAGKVAQLASALDAVPEGEGTALDNSVLVWANENATGTHGLENIPVVFLGRAGGRLLETGRVVDAGLQSNHRLATTVLRLMGVPAEGFGARPACGPLAGLRQA